MKLWKLRVTLLLVLILVLTSAGAVPGAIVEKGNQLINLVNPLVTLANFPFTGMYVRNSNGDAVLFPGTDQVLVITKVMWTFTAADSSLNEPMQLNIGDYFRMGGQFVNGSASGSYGIIPGIPITNFATSIYVCKQVIGLGAHPGEFVHAAGGLSRSQPLSLENRPPAGEESELSKQPLTRRRSAMTRRRFSAVPALLLILALLRAGGVSASIINNVNQIGHGVSPQPPTGQFTLASMQGVDSSGDLNPIPGPLPANQVFILTKVTYNFTATDTTVELRGDLERG